MENIEETTTSEKKDDVLEEITEYKIDDTNILGKGSFGVVYKGTQKKGNKSNPVALKEIPKEIVDDKEKIQALADEIYISSILNEEEKGKNNSSIEGRENIASFLDIAEIDGKKYLAYEFCNGGDLKRYLKYFKKFDENMVQYIMRQVIRGIYHLHKRKIIHHDIKPENILIELFPDDKKDKKDKEDKEHKEDKKDKEDKEDKEHKEEIIKKVMMVTDIKNKKVYKDKSIMSDEELKEILLKSRMKVSDFGLSKFKEEGNNLVEVSGSPLYIEPNLFDNNVDPLTVESESNSDWKVEERNFIDLNLIKSKCTISDSKKEENKLNSFYEEDDENENKKLYFIDYVKGGNKLFNSVKVESKGENISTNYSSRKRKRGKAKTKNDNRKHNFDSNDNLQRKIQVHYLTFIVSFVNDLLKNLNYKQRFKNLEYDFKIKIDKISTKSLKNNCIGKIISNNSISEKYKTIKCNEREKYNLKIYNQIIGNNILKKILSEKYLDISKKTFFLI